MNDLQKVRDHKVERGTICVYIYTYTDIKKNPKFKSQGRESYDICVHMYIHREHGRNTSIERVKLKFVVINIKTNGMPPSAWKAGSLGD